MLGFAANVDYGVVRDAQARRSEGPQADVDVDVDKVGDVVGAEAGTEPEERFRFSLLGAGHHPKPLSSRFHQKFGKCWTCKFPSHFLG